MSGTIAPIDLGTVAGGTGGFVLLGEGASNRAGTSVASAGDVNGDGFEDVIIGAPFVFAGGGGAPYALGAAYVVFGQADGFSSPIDLGQVALGQGGFAIRGGPTNDLAGASVASAGDLNGDGFDDVLVGARNATSGSNTAAGTAYVVFGKAGDFGTPVDLGQVAQGQGGFVLRGEDAFDYAGNTVASAGDLNGDGFDDLIIGTRYSSGAGNAEPGAGTAYVVFGKAAGFGATLDLGTIAQGQGGFAIQGEDIDDLAGRSVASAGDVNGDGFDDLIIGAPYADGPANARQNAGAAYVVFGKAGGFGAAIDLGAVAQGQGGFVIQGEDADDRAGGAVASAGDVNGDGIDDLVIGAPSSDGGTGAAYVVFGRTGGFGAAVDLGAIAQGQGGFVIQGEDLNDTAGNSVASAGDVNGDGFDDLIIGASGADGDGNAKDFAGAAYVVFGRAGAPLGGISLADVAAGQGGFVIQGEDEGDRAGVSVASAGDLNGDGFDDLIVGAGGADGAANDEPFAGAAYVIYGRDFTEEATATGTPGPDSLLGLDGPGIDFDDRLIGGAGNDTLVSLTGADTLVGGTGNDVLSVGGLASLTIRGGRGNDTLALDMAGATLDLRATPNGFIRGIETIDITGTGNNRLIVNRAEVLNLSDSSNTLTVLRDQGDTVSVIGTGWRYTGVANGFDRYVNGDAVLKIQQVGPAATPTAGNDSITGTTGADTIDALRGNDTVFGGNGADSLRGNDGEDSLDGGSASDTLNGGAGNDTLVAGTGQDLLTGGLGLDTFRFTDAASGRDTVADWVAADDTIRVSAAGFGGGLTAGIDLGATGRFVENVTGAATSAAGVGQFTFETDTGILRWDADGTGAGAAVQIALLTGVASLAATEIVVVA